MHHILQQTSLPFHLHPIQHQQKSYPSGSMISNHPQQQQQQQQQFCSSSSIQQYNPFPYIHSYPQENSTIYHSDRTTAVAAHFPEHSQHPNYSSYELNKTYPDCQQYNLLRPSLESDHYVGYYSQPSTENEHLLHNFNPPIGHYPDLNSQTNAQTDQHYHHHHHHHGLVKAKEEQKSSLMPIHNENDYHWNQTTCSTTEW